ncbi:MULTISPECIES: lysine exporter LysO family protein [unclassified Acinetobacter]|uniref:lysine exporter LysO family protein n=1 Tax=unclassified Acinetobacter TaxID=196816 RepID=UPI0024494593|nr:MULTISPECIES: lysine exporter LysO family protein [unclassified Acinetobacter]MDH0031992.1 lysine exporter LysO family protein [Acinetobacter sp. GD04021]MDH0887401.1 lysine exporter LysO family protein [Acinetobacter sp. GD03873]MDH1083996.1 lysine exporter LysO family protein [Acinetobacter sp. GD03983]MDH2190717.1 lysine exporter LysO family protein [Acinetobacter sp. GD03645]MDH2202207.1 lysine exporter LysO family protein [Acinetobacter sp. GD03647]
MQSFTLIFQIFIAISLGYFIAPHLSQAIKKFVFKILPYFSYILLIAVAFELTKALNHIQNPATILPPALLIAFTTSIGSFSICLLTFKLVDRQSIQGKISFHLFINALKNIAKAFLALAVGILLGIIVNLSNLDIAFNSWYLLLVFIFLIGIELAFTQFDRSWLSWKILLVPIAAFIGSCLASVLNYFLLLDHYKLNEVMALAQGYGWYSMSGILFTELHSAQLGGIGLLTDLFREIFAILLMYCLGWRFPRSAISSAGATSMDVTLAMVKQSCGTHYVPHAMMSGLILTLLAPLLISLFLNLKL